jgi:hypothetical protein
MRRAFFHLFETRIEVDNRAPAGRAGPVLGRAQED